MLTPLRLRAQTYHSNRHRKGYPYKHEEIFYRQLGKPVPRRSFVPQPAIVIPQLPIIPQVPIPRPNFLPAPAA
ncbi:hypothetical protein PRIPAC_75151 [Pristionchus pacificus]|uniref:Uncharacterized protein n=1 Tax=Pristionchus pacificus TaxID=54126 RepID=A0A2A6D002_PRIPA|nr:hypothetical protein PRIPAC_75151 [Pristionchus pacificus]|eukprot:PDM83708.1 hypothetical protein PRIPAC_30195 [Pristionchus pacificus]